MHEYGSHGMGYVLKGEELKSVLTKLYPKKVKDNPECLNDENWIYDAVFNSGQLDYFSNFTGSGVCIHEDGTLDFGNAVFYCDGENCGPQYAWRRYFRTEQVEEENNQ